MAGCASRLHDTHAGALGVENFGRRCETAGSVGPRGTELVHVAAVRLDGVSPKGERAGQHAVRGGVAGESGAAASAAAEFSGGFDSDWRKTRANLRSG